MFEIVNILLIGLDFGLYFIKLISIPSQISFHLGMHLMLCLAVKLSYIEYFCTLKLLKLRIKGNKLLFLSKIWNLNDTLTLICVQISDKSKFWSLN